MVVGIVDDACVNSVVYAGRLFTWFVICIVVYWLVWLVWLLCFVGVCLRCWVLCSFGLCVCVVFGGLLVGVGFVACVLAMLLV